jgi:hypothetical protein
MHACNAVVLAADRRERERQGIHSGSQEQKNGFSFSLPMELFFLL